MQRLVQRDVVIGASKLVRQRGPLRVERVVERVLEEVDERRRVDVGEAIETAREVGRVVIRAEQAAEPNVEQLLHHLPRLTRTHWPTSLADLDFR